MKIYLNRLLFMVLCILPLAAEAQRTVDTDQQTWLGVFSQMRFSQRWGLWFDGHFRLREQFVEKPAVAIFRPGLTYYLYDDLRLTAGYAYVHFFPAEGHEEVAVPEHRPWQQLQWFSRFPGLRLMNWVRLEERFRRKVKDADELAPGYQFNYRARANLAAFIPFTKKKFAPGGWQFLVNDEVHVNFGKNVGFNQFDQNRLFLGLVYQLNEQAQLHGGYMQVYQQLPAGNQFRRLHAIRLFYFQNFDWRKT